MNKTVLLYIVCACVVVVAFWWIVNDVANAVQALAIKLNAGV